MIRMIICLILIESALIAGFPLCASAFDRAELSRIVRSSTLPDEQKITALAKLLDRRIVPENITLSEKEAEDYGRDLAQLVTAIAYLNHPIKNPGTALSIHRLIQSGASSGFRNTQQVMTYLNIALGLAGGNPPENVMLTLINDGNTSDDVLKLTLRAMTVSGVPIRAIPRLLQFGQHNRSHIERDDLGPSHPRRVYPVRKAAAECFEKLGVDVKRTMAHETPIGWKEQISVTNYLVQRQSLAGKLEQWILSDDESKWRPALESARSISGPEVATMLRSLKEKSGLPDYKRKILEGRQ